MCGLVGFYVGDKSRQNLNTKYLAQKMTASLSHRGPDGSGVWSSNDDSVALGHTRLSITDLSDAGAQPMTSSCGRYVIVYNGEIYSANEMLSRLRANGQVLRGHSDTEILLEFIANFGLDTALNSTIGMFAFALYDIVERKTFLVRDRLGIKPLYWGLKGDCFIFGSELKSLLHCESFGFKMDRNSVASFMRHNYIAAPHSIFLDVYKLEPGTVLALDQQFNVTKKTYWGLNSHISDSPKSFSKSKENGLLKELDDLLVDSVGRRMNSEVPFGGLLSGGIDSSLVCALMAEISSNKIQTFAIGFEKAEFNEAPHAAAVAEHLGTDHTELYLKEQDTLDLVTKLPQIYCEPFADSSQLPTLILSKLTKQHVTVALSGDGGDEIFAGYSRYLAADELYGKFDFIPSFFRQILKNLVHSFDTETLDKLKVLLPSRYKFHNFGEKLKTFAESLDGTNQNEMYRYIISHWKEPNELVIGSDEYRGILWDDEINSKLPTFLSRMQYFDTLTYLPDDILTKVDRASMQYGLEVRVPLLDHRLVELSWQMPRSMKVRNGVSKWALRQCLYKRVPESIIDRPKMGFGIPINIWLIGALKDWAEHLLDKQRLDNQGLLNSEPIVQMWEKQKAGETWGYPLWNVLMIQSWIDCYPNVDF
jgi:asparagine synthase (glutamine-hydrolysing)